MSYLKVADHDLLVRDSSTGAIINIDKSTFEDAARRKNTSSTIKNLQSDVELLKNELSEIKNLLREMVTNGST